MSTECACSALANIKKTQTSEKNQHLIIPPEIERLTSNKTLWGVGAMVHDDNQWTSRISQTSNVDDFTLWFMQNGWSSPVLFGDSAQYP